MKYSKEAFMKAIVHGCADSYFIDKKGNVRTRTATIKYGMVIVRDGEKKARFTVEGFMRVLARIMNTKPTYDYVLLGLANTANVLAEEGR